MSKQGSKKLNVVPLGKQQAKQPRGEVVRVKLLDAAEALLLEQDAHQLRLDDVLADAGVARNTLYKHFKDLEALAEEALLRGFARNVELDAQAISGALGRCQNKDDFRQAMNAITRASQSADRAPRRMLRIKLLAMASSRPALGERVAAVQADMTERLADEFRAGAGERVTSALTSPPVQPRSSFSPTRSGGCYWTWSPTPKKTRPTGST